MPERATGVIQERHREATEYAEADAGPRLVRLHATNVFRGELEGEGTVEHLVLYSDEDSGSYTGLERVTARLAGRSGTFVLQHSGIFGAGAVKGTWFVVAGSGTDGFAGLVGEGTYVRDPEQSQDVGFALDYVLDSPGRPE